MSSEIIVRARDLRKSYTYAAGSLDVLRGINFEIRRGEIVSIMGQSGVGKSTLLNIIGLLDRPTSGALEFGLENGREVDAATLSKRHRARLRNQRLGFIFQFFHLLPDLNVLQNVLLPQMIAHGWFDYRRKKKELTDRARELLTRVHVDRDHHKPNQLSGGERQRVAIARALMNEPDLVLCDEPTGNLDTATSDQMHDLFVDLNQNLGTTFLMVTHDRSLANRAERKLEMVDGQFIEVAAPSLR